MNRFFKISVAGNVLLTLLALWLLRRMHEATDRSPVSAPAEISGVPAEAREATPAMSAPDPKPFRWSQLESANDYRVYVANLRAIGCPEKIIWAIVQMDVDGAFDFKRRQLHLDGSGTGRWSQQEEMEIVASLMGDQPASATSVAVAASDSSRGSTSPTLNRGKPPSMPLVLQPVDESALNLTEAQKQEIGQLRQQFMDEIGGTNQDPNDPAYLARWQKAQVRVDDTLRGLFGSKFYVDYRLQAANAAPASQ
jgi:hypothetical protein